MDTTNNRNVQPISLGAQNFAELRKKGGLYVDKTDFLTQWWKSPARVTAVARPRRFGKTLMMSTIERFFSIEHDDQEELFGDLQVWASEEMRAQAGTCPVISITFGGLKFSTWETMREALYWKIRQECFRFRYLLGSEKVRDEDRRELADIIEGRITEVAAVFSLVLLSRMLCDHHGRKTIILFDEYDTPMQEAWAGGYWKEMVRFM